MGSQAERFANLNGDRRRIIVYIGKSAKQIGVRPRFENLGLTPIYTDLTQSHAVRAKDSSPVIDYSTNEHCLRSAATNLSRVGLLSPSPLTDC